MTNKDDDLPLPTRHGKPTGDANERTMAVHVDRRGIQKTYRQNPDGSMTRLSTRLGHNEYVTTFPDGVEKESEECDWSFDLYPLKLDGSSFVADTMDSEGDEVITSSLSWGSKTRRKKLKKNADGTFSPKLMESEFDAELDPKEAIRCYGRWYWRSKLVTWTALTLIPYPPYGTVPAVIGVVKYGRVMLSVSIMQNFVPQTSIRMYAACVVVGDGGIPYIRVALGRSDGSVEGYALEIRDYTMDGSMVWSQNLGYVTGGTGWYPEGGSFVVHNVIPDISAFSPNGRRFIIAAVPATSYAKAVLLNITRPASGDPVVSPSVYTPPVSMPADVSIDTDETTNWGDATVYETPGLTGPLENPASSAPYESHEGPHGTTRLIDEVFITYTMSIRAAGFTKNNVESAIVKVKGALHETHQIRKTTNEEHTVYDGVTTTTWWSSFQNRWVTYTHPTSSSYTFRSSFSQWDGTEKRGEVIGLSWCEGDVVKWSDEKELAFSTAHTGYDRYYENIEHSFSVASDGTWIDTITTNNQLRRTINSEGTSSPGPVTAEYAPITADFLDRAAVLVWWTKRGAYTEISGTAVHNVRTGIWEDGFADANDSTVVQPALVWAEQSLQVRTGESGKPSAVDVFRKKPLDILYGAASFCSGGWCPKAGGSALVLERRDDGEVLADESGAETPMTEYLFGRLFRRGKWYHVVISPNEPGQTVSMSGLKPQVSPFA